MSPARIALFLAFLSVSALTGASCQRSVSNPHVQGSATGSGPSSGVQVVAGSGATWPIPGKNGPGQMFVAINAYRLAKGLRQLDWHYGIGEVAELHHNDMNSRSFFSIVNPDGVDPYQRMVSSSPRMDFDNSIVFLTQFGAGTASQTPQFNALIDNTASRSVIENPNITHFGSFNNGSLGTWIFAINARP